MDHEKEDNQVNLPPVNSTPVISSSQDSQDSDEDPEPSESEPCSTDAGHPRFVRAARAAAAAAQEASVQKNFCCLCATPLADDELSDHFNANHPYHCKCQYCGRPVYKYALKIEGEKPEEKDYHRCLYLESESEFPGSPSSPSVMNDMNCNEINGE